MPSEARKLLSTTDVLLQVSKLEGWGCTVNEALMYGNRVIVSDSVGSRALLRNKVDCGQIFESGNWDVLKNCIEYEISKVNPAKRNVMVVKNEMRLLKQKRNVLQI